MIHDILELIVSILLIVSAIDLTRFIWKFHYLFKLTDYLIMKYATFILMVISLYEISKC